MTTQTAPTVFVVDDDRRILNSLRWLVESVDLNVETFGSAEQFLRAYQPERSGCLVLDIRMPKMGGLRLLEHKPSCLPNSCDWLYSITRISENPQLSQGTS
jgi:FixJ family two-component response regulator